MRKIAENWIKISRKILEWGWWSDKNTTRLFIYMLLKANWKDGNFLGVDIKRGSFASSIATISRETGLTIREVRTAIKHLKTTSEVTSYQHPKFTVFTVNNYDKYQTSDKVNDKRATSERQRNDKQMTSERQASDKRATTIEERKNIRKKERKKGRKEEEKNNPPYPPCYFPDDEKLDSAFADFVDFRRRAGAPLNDIDCEKVKRKVLEMSMQNGVIDNDKAVEILEQSIVNGWKGLFPLDRDKKPVQQKQQGYDWDAIRAKYAKEDSG